MYIPIVPKTKIAVPTPPIIQNARRVAWQLAARSSFLLFRVQTEPEIWTGPYIDPNRTVNGPKKVWTRAWDPYLHQNCNYLHHYSKLIHFYSLSKIDIANSKQKSNFWNSPEFWEFIPILEVRSSFEGSAFYRVPVTENSPKSIYFFLK